MASTIRRRGMHRVWLVVSVVLFFGAAFVVAAGYRELHNWLFLAGSFANVMVFRALGKARAQAG
jgi:hypothetical protein